jgi:hypothetical protein
MEASVAILLIVVGSGWGLAVLHRSFVETSCLSSGLQGKAYGKGVRFVRSKQRLCY